MDRRDLLTVAGLAALAAPAVGAAQTPAAAARGLRILHVWAGADGVSRQEELFVTNDAPPLPSMAVRMRPERSGPAGAPTWHNSPGRVFVVNITGDLDCETGDGKIGYVPTGGIAFLEDVTGKGHLTRPRSPTTLLFLEPPAGFDVVAWAKGA